MESSYILVEDQDQQEDNQDNQDEQPEEIEQKVLKYFNFNKIKKIKFEFNFLELNLKNKNLREDKKLFIDELLSLVKCDLIAGGDYSEEEGELDYPPRNYLKLKKLILLILNSNNSFSLLIIYYLLIIYTEPTTLDQSEFVSEFLIPFEFLKNLNSILNFDLNKFNLGVKLLTNTKISSPDFIQKTLVLLSTTTEITSTTERSSLILNYLNLTNLVSSPSLNSITSHSEIQLEIYITALIQSTSTLNLLKAWKKQSQFSSNINKELQTKLILIILSNSFGNNPTQKPLSHHLPTLLSLPFTPFEHQILLSFSLSLSSPSSPFTPPQKSLILNFTLSKLISNSKLVEAIKFNKTIKELNLIPSKFGQQERDDLVRNLRECLGRVERDEIDLEMEMDEGSVGTSGVGGNGKEGEGGKRLITNTQLLNPIWQSQPPPLPSTSTSTSSKPYHTLQPPSSSFSQQQSQPTVNLPTPLSSSPFLRKEKPLVSTKDGSFLGGGGKGVLRALREDKGGLVGSGGSGGNGGGGSLFRDSPVRLNFAASVGGGSVSGASSISTSRFNSPQPQPQPLVSQIQQSQIQQTRQSSTSISTPTPNNNNSGSSRPTLTGFGTIRSLPLFLPSPSQASPQPSFTQPQSQSQPQFNSPTSKPTASGVTPYLSPKINLDPAIAQTLSRAEEANSPTGNNGLKNKRRVSNSGVGNLNSNSSGNRKNNNQLQPQVQESEQTSASGGGGGNYPKRRALSEEFESRPSSSLGISNISSNSSKKNPPGSFPLEQEQDHEEEEQEQEEEREREKERESTRKPKKSTTTTSSSTITSSNLKRRTTRASSVQPLSSSFTQVALPSTPIRTTKKKSVGLDSVGGAGGNETPRRSSRLTTPARELEEVSSGTGGGGRKGRK